MPTYSANQGDDEDEGAGEVTQDDDEDEVGEGAGEVTRPRGIAWWQLNLYVPPSLLLLPGSSINNSPGNQKPLLPCSSPPFLPSFIHCWCTDHHQESLWSEMEVEVEEEEEGKDEKEEVVKEEK